MRRGLAGAGSVLAGAVVFLVAWKLVVVLGDWQPFVLPPPESVAARLISGWADGTIGPNAATTLLEVVLGFSVGSTAAVLLGYLLARSHFAERVLSPYVVAAQSTPVLALAPLFAIWFGTGLVSKVVMCSLIVFFPVAVATMVGIREVDRSLLEMSRAFRASRLQTLLRIEIPGALPSIFGGLRVGATLAVVGAVVAEWAGADSGLGVLLLIAKGSRFDMPLALATLVTIAALGVACYLVVVAVERRLVGARG
jgi:putative riboflavin transport system permease protein